MGGLPHALEAPSRPAYLSQVVAASVLGVQLRFIQPVWVQVVGHQVGDDGSQDHSKQKVYGDGAGSKVIVTAAHQHP